MLIFKQKYCIFEGLDSERGTAWRCEYSFSLLNSGNGVTSIKCVKARQCYRKSASTQRPESIVLVPGAKEPRSVPPAPWDGAESVADYARKGNLPATKTLDLGGGVKMELVLIPAGKFIMGTSSHENSAGGQTMVLESSVVLFVVAMTLLVRARRNRKRLQFSMAFMLLMTSIAAVGVWGGVRWNEALKHPDYFPNEHPAHPVTLTQPFYLGKFVVTQEQYQAVVGATPSFFKGKDNPVENVTWDDAQAFCKKLTEQTKLTVNLPTEAEWEYACRAGTTTTYHSGDAEADLARVAWYSANSNGTTHPVGQKEPNAFGLYDMHGNVWQWCEDWWNDCYYTNSPADDPQGPSHGADRVLRGGSWAFHSLGCRSAFRRRAVRATAKASVSGCWCVLSDEGPFE